MSNQNANPVSDQAVRDFLLGKLKAPDQERFEYQLFTDGELEAQVRRAEYEIADDFAYRRLNESERAAFAHFLVTSDRKKIVQVSQSLRERFAPTKAGASRGPLAQRVSTIFNLKRAVWRYAFAAIVLMILLATTLLVTKESRIAQKLIPRFIQRKTTSQAPPERANHSTATTSPPHAEQRPPLTSHENQLTGVALSSRTSLEQSPQVDVRDSAIAGRFQLLVENVNESRYHADLTRVGGTTVFSAEALTPSGTNPVTVYFEVPPQVLQAGNYQITLTGVNGTTNTFFFRVP